MWQNNGFFRLHFTSRHTETLVKPTKVTTKNRLTLSVEPDPRLNNLRTKKTGTTSSYLCGGVHKLQHTLSSVQQHQQFHDSLGSLYPHYSGSGIMKDSDSRTVFSHDLCRVQWLYSLQVISESSPRGHWSTTVVLLLISSN